MLSLKHQLSKSSLKMYFPILDCLLGSYHEYVSGKVIVSRQCRSENHLLAKMGAAGLETPDTEPSKLGTL